MPVRDDCCEKREETPACKREGSKKWQEYQVIPTLKALTKVIPSQLLFSKGGSCLWSKFKEPKTSLNEPQICDFSTRVSRENLHENSRNSTVKKGCWCPFMRWCAPLPWPFFARILEREILSPSLCTRSALGLPAAHFTCKHTLHDSAPQTVSDPRATGKNY